MSKPIIEVTKNAWKKMGSIIQSKTFNGNNFHNSFFREVTPAIVLPFPCIDYSKQIF